MTKPDLPILALADLRRRIWVTKWRELEQGNAKTQCVLPTITLTQALADAVVDVGRYFGTSS
jgi:hypothetical protein